MKERLTKLIKEAQERYIYAEEQAQYLMDNDVDCVKHGEWIMGVDIADYEYGTCSVCGYVEYDKFPTGNIPNYCSGCGAKMKGGEG